MVSWFGTGAAAMRMRANEHRAAVRVGVLLGGLGDQDVHVVIVRRCGREGRAVVRTD
jgi:hypothetical protein